MVFDVVEAVSIAGFFNPFPALKQRDPPQNEAGLFLPSGRGGFAR